MNKQDKRPKGGRGIEWRSVPGYEGLYEASEDGQIRSLPRRTTSGKVLSQQVNNSGYLRVSIGTRYLYVHHLVAAAFIGSRPDRRDVNHKNGIKTDNRADNLEYVTRAENMRHARDNGLHNNYGDGHYNAKLTAKDVAEMRDAHEKVGLTDDMYPVWADAFGVNIRTIKDVIEGKTWGSVNE